MLLAAALTVAVSLSNPMIVSTDWVAENLESSLIVLVEVGEKRDYEQGHIPGARFLAREDVVEDCEGIPNELPSEERLVAAFTAAGVGDSKRIVIYSRTPLIATRAWFTLDYLGHGSRTSILDGGWEKWTAEQRPTTTVQTIARPAAFTVFERPYSIVPFDEMKDLVRRRGTMDAQFLSIDARPNAAFRAGHIPDAINIPWTANLTAEHPQVFRSEEELRRLYVGAGINRDAIVITYCRTGMEASMTYFVLRSLGYDIALFDGSMTQWTKSKETVVVMSDDR
jgi:thiosulfate/3-mercaptopyruvate sulfurtransferase